MTGNFDMGSRVIVAPSRGAYSSMRQEQDWRAVPLMTMVQAPQTSSRQPESQTTGVDRLPSAVTGSAAICFRTAMTLAPVSGTTANSSQREVCPVLPSV